MCLINVGESEAFNLCSLQQESSKTFFPPHPSVLFHFTLPHGRCTLTFAGTMFLSIWIFIALQMLWSNKRPFGGQIHSKVDL